MSRRLRTRAERDVGGTWGRDSQDPGRETVAARMLQDTRAFLRRHGRDRLAERYLQDGIQTFDARAGQDELAGYEGRAQQEQR